MKNKGFTLIELLAVLTVLALVALITITTVTGSLKKYKTTLYEDQIKNIENAARVWASDNLLILPTNSEEGGATCIYGATCSATYKRLIITLEDLQNGGYIDKDLKNVRTNRNFGNIEIVIEKNGNKLDYEVIDQEYYAYQVGDRVTITVSDNTTTEFYVIENSDKRNNYVKAITVNSSSSSIAYTSVNDYLNENYTWNNAIEKRLMKKTEYDNVISTIENDAERTWINGTYWLNDTYAYNNAWYVDGTTAANKAQTDGAYVRPMIKIRKSYVKLSSN